MKIIDYVIWLQPCRREPDHSRRIFLHDATVQSDRLRVVYRLEAL